MDEEITREIIQEIVQETIRVSSQSDHSTWIPTLGLILSIGVLTFSIIKFGQNQKQHNKAQEKSQKQFNKTQEIAKNLEFIKQLEHYGDQFARTDKKFIDSEQTYDDCINCASDFLQILNRLSYLKIKKLVPLDFVQFFEVNFNSGRAYLGWLKYTHRGPGDFEKLFSHFHEVKNILHYSYPEMILESPYYYYVHQIHADSKYDPKLDKTDSKTYTSTQDDVNKTR